MYTTQMIPIPELVPFRLTRQLLGVLAPHDPTGPLLAGPMAALLGALRGARDLLAAVMALFCREPLTVRLRLRVCSCVFG